MRPSMINISSFLDGEMKNVTKDRKVSIILTDIQVKSWTHKIHHLGFGEQEIGPRRF